MHHTNPLLTRPTPPYDTGKVKIGLCYTPPATRYVDSDDFAVQSALLPVSVVRLTFAERVRDFFRSFV